MRSDGPLGQWLLTGSIIEKVWGVGVGRNIVSFVAATMHLLIFLEIYKRGLYHSWSAALSKQVIHYDLPFGFPYYILTTPLPNWEG